MEIVLIVVAVASFLAGGKLGTEGKLVVRNGSMVEVKANADTAPNLRPCTSAFQADCVKPAP